MDQQTFETRAFPEGIDHTAPDGSEIRLFPTMKGGGLCHCTLREGKTSSPVCHETVEEIWYILSGEGEIWRRLNDHEEIDPVRPGTALTIPPQTQFQFRNLGPKPLCILITTMPPWPGPQEAVPVTGYWN
jgi:mannose-6-phosphate isomerase-like protein (cupin superfamily)